MTVPKDVETLLETLLQLGVDEGLVAKARQVLGNNAEDIGEWIELAVVLREHEEYHAALATYDVAMRRFPDSHILWSNRGYVLLVWELYDEALSHFSNALEIRPDYIHALAHMAATYERLHEFEKAAATYRRVLEIESSNAKAWNSLGVCIQMLGDEEEAIRCFERSIELQQDFTDPLFNLAALYNSRREFARALPYISRLLEIDPHDYRAKELRNEVLEEPEHSSEPRTRDIFQIRKEPMSVGRQRSGWRDALYRSDGSRRPDEDIVRECGKIWLRLALLDDVIHRRVDAGETSINYPLRLFLSYKWGSEKENRWVAMLADKLVERGWDVVFDDYRDETLEHPVEEFVSRIATCSVFLAIVTPEYVEHGINSREPTWVFDEYQIAMNTKTTTEMGMYCIALTPDGTLAVPERQDTFLRISDTGLASIDPAMNHIIEKCKAKSNDPADFDRFGGIPAIIIQDQLNPYFEEIHKIPSDEDLDDWLDKHFSYEGPNLSEAERSTVFEELEELKSEVDGIDVVVDRLRALLNQYPFVFDAWRILVLRLTDAGRLSEAVEALDIAIQQVHPWDKRFVMELERIDLLNQLGRPIDAVRGALQILKTRPLDWASHFYVGNRLDDCDELWGARNHLLIACNDEHANAEAFNTLGVIYMGLGFLLRAQLSFEAALQRDATFERAKINLARIWEVDPPHALANSLQVTTSGTGCTVCPAMYPLSDDLPMLCAACGGRRPVNENCPYCGHDGFAPWSNKLGELVTVLCPTCHTGSLVKKDKFSL